MQEGEDPVQDGKDPIQDGKDPTQEGKDPVQDGKDPIPEGEDFQGWLWAAGCCYDDLVSTGGKRSLVPLIRIMPAQLELS